MSPPAAAKRPVVLEKHGDKRTDNYFWMRDDARNNPEAIAWLEAENRYADAVLAGQQPLKQTLLDELISRIPQQDSSVPVVRRGWRYQSRYAEGQEYPCYFRQPAEAAEAGEWQLLLDGNARAAGAAYYGLGSLTVSPDNQLMAVAEDRLSRRIYSIRIRCLVSGEWRDDCLENVSPDVAWSADSQTLWYVVKDEQTLLPWQVWRHRIGTPQSADVRVYEEQDDTFYVGLYTTTSERYVGIALNSSTTSEVRLLDSEAPEAAPICFLPRQTDREYDLDHYDGRFWLRDNRDGKNFGLYTQSTPGDGDRQCVIAPHDERVLEAFQLFRDWLVVEERSRGLTELRQIHHRSGEARTLPMDDAAWTAWLGHNPHPDTALLRYGYASMTTPDTVYELNLDSGERRVLKQRAVAGFDRNNYVSERLWIPMRDGVEVPVSLVWRRDRYQPGSNPLLMYGYGAYGMSMDPGFSASRLSLLDRGFVWALTHLRGGGEMGQAWYDDGRLMHKMNTFTDFIDLTEALLARGYGDPANTFAEGRSAGGLLMGAVLNMRPDLWRGVLAGVPFVDVLTTMQDPSIPLTTGEYDEWGNPEDPDAYHYIAQYSPYDNVRPRHYPPMLVTTGLHDSQVQYWEPAKWVARLREIKTDRNVLLLRTDMEVGHGGKSGRFAGQEEIAEEYAFLIGLADGSLSPLAP
ncbi:S9 family peptidase [Pantoea sp. 1.19]|uniref:S9 family peptidase n=1 Tax=Pantoea sp. 1.19 TaxID=1925589 RepID=UPI000948D853|nr:prolyl oligopeptidase family serine peptidase [Pantoea sp. 1.19]